MFVLLSEEIARQLNNSNAQILFGLASYSAVLEEAVALAKRPIRVIYVKETESESFPAGGIDFNELISTDGKGNWLRRGISLISYFLLRSRSEQFENL